MQIIIDGQKIPVTPRVTQDVLITLKNIARTLRWGISYDTKKEIIYINSKNSLPPIETTDRISTGSDAVTSTESTRLVGKIICLDPGHGGSDPGAVGPTGTMEKENNLAIALMLAYILQKKRRRCDPDPGY